MTANSTWIVRLNNTGDASEAKIFAVSSDKDALTLLVRSLISSKRFTDLSGIISIDNPNEITDEQFQKMFDDKSLLLNNIFNFAEYFNYLSSTNVSGRTLIVADLIPTTMTLLNGCELPSTGVIVIARQQTQGRGRGSNQWESPRGCALFTSNCKISVDSLLGRRLSLLQLIVAVAIVQAINRKNTESERLKIKIKWPNDVYLEKAEKLGGILATSSMDTKYADVSIGSNMSTSVGCGVNIFNTFPSICLNAIISQAADESIKPFTIEEFIARLMNFIDDWIIRMTNKDLMVAHKAMEDFTELYQKFWMHQNEQYYVEQWKETVRVRGIDEYGFLCVERTDGTLVSLVADAHSLDIHNNIIKEKM